MNTFHAALALLVAASTPVNVSGTWQFSVDLDNGQHGSPVFVLQQHGHELTGTYRGPFGEQSVTGEVHGDRVDLVVKAQAGRDAVVLTYSGSVTGPSAMAGTMTRDLSGAKTPGKWTAKRQ